MSECNLAETAPGVAMKSLHSNTEEVKKNHKLI